MTKNPFHGHSPLRSKAANASSQPQQPVTISPGHHFQGFDEEKCRNVLVRHCAYIPRNYQYRDGIGLVFLVLRDHLGDEHLGRAGGVLYELIEVDCQHSDDPRAAYQRWKYDHMNRHADLELPHIPHLTTIASAITPTRLLSQWREAHPERYVVKLSDHNDAFRNEASSPGILRTRKDWMIEYTMYVSSCQGGTSPYRSFNAKEFHEMYWRQDWGRRGTFVEERFIEIPESKGTSEVHVDTTEAEEAGSPKPKCRRRFLPFLQAVSRNRVGCAPTTQDVDADLFTRSKSTMSFSDVLSRKSLQPSHQWQIPNAIFARKFGLFTDSDPLPPSIKELPIAESKVVNKLKLDLGPDFAQECSDQGPLTPQLWFDGGLDFRWKRMSWPVREGS